MTVGITHELDGSWSVSRNVNVFPVEEATFDTKKQAVAHAPKIARSDEKIIEGRGTVIREGKTYGLDV